MSSRQQIFEAIRPRLEGLALRILGDPQAASAVVDVIGAQWHLAPPLSRDVGRAVLVASLVGTSLLISRARRGPARPPAREQACFASPADDVVATLFLALEELPPSQRSALLMHKAFAMDPREIARHLGLSEADCRAVVEGTSAAFAKRVKHGSGL